MKFDSVYYEQDSLKYPPGNPPWEMFQTCPDSHRNHNSIKEMQEKPNSEFGRMKRFLIVGTRNPQIRGEPQGVGPSGPLHLLRMYGHVPVLLPGLQLHKWPTCGSFREPE